MTDLRTLSRLVRETYAAHVIFDAAGIPAANVYVVKAISPATLTEQIGVRAVQGDKDFTITVGAPPGTWEEFKSEWIAGMAVIAQANADALEAFVDSAQLRGHLVELLSAMQAKGLRIGYVS